MLSCRWFDKQTRNDLVTVARTATQLFPVGEPWVCFSCAMTPRITPTPQLLCSGAFSKNHCQNSCFGGRPPIQNHPSCRVRYPLHRCPDGVICLPCFDLHNSPKKLHRSISRGAKVPTLPPMCSFLVHHTKHMGGILPPQPSIQSPVGHMPNSPFDSVDAATEC